MQVPIKLPISGTGRKNSISSPLVRKISQRKKKIVKEFEEDNFTNLCKQTPKFENSEINDDFGSEANVSPKYL